jgi:hypothetical protein
VEFAPAARRPRPFGLPVARLGVCAWPDGSRTLYAKGEHGEEYVVERAADVPPFIARLFVDVDLVEWALRREQVTLLDDGRVERVVIT